MLSIAVALLLGIASACGVGSSRPPATTAPAPQPSGSTSSTTTDFTRPSATDETTPRAPTYEASIRNIDDDVAQRMATSWRPGCPVPLDELRLLTLTHWDFNQKVSTGEMVVHADVADDVVEVFRILFDASFPVERIQLVDTFGANDLASMQANNTSAFNCRHIAGTTRWSEHAYGRAIDLNPLINPPRAQR